MDIIIPKWPETCMVEAPAGSASYDAGSRPAHTVVLHEAAIEPATETSDMSLATNVYPGGKAKEA